MKKAFSTLVLLIICVISFTLTGCNKNEKTTIVAGKEGGYLIVRPEKISGKLDNPGMGWGITEDCYTLGLMDGGSTGDYDGIDAINFTSTWSLMEPEEGKYDWTLLDEAINKWGSLGKKIHLRISTESFMQPNTYYGAPNWLKTKYNVATQEFPYVAGVAPVAKSISFDVTDPNYLACLDRFLTAVAEKIKDVDCIGDIDIRGYGLWGEWHTGYMFETTQEKREALIELMDHWYQIFKDSGHALVMSASWDPNYIDRYGVESGNPYKDFYDWAGLDYWNTLCTNATFRRDGAGGALLTQDNRFMFDYYRSGKRMYLHGEFNSGKETYTDVSSFTAVDAVNDMLYKLRANYSTIVGWTTGQYTSFQDEGNLDWLYRGYEMMGYRLSTDYIKYPESMKVGSTSQIMASWVNTAVGVFPYDYDLTYYLLDKTNKVVYKQTDTRFDARTYLQGDINNYYVDFSVPETMELGNYTLALAITDEKGNPAIELGQAGEIDNTRIYKVGEVVIDNATTNKNVAEKMTYKELQNYKFEKNTAYEVTFSYTGSMTTKDYVFGTNNSYIFRLDSSSTNYIGYLKWQDISNEEGFKTCAFTTNSDKSFKASIVSDNFGTIEVGDCYVEKVGTNFIFDSFSKTTDLTDFYDNYITSSGFTGRIITDDSSYKDDVINGEASVQIFGKDKGDVYGLYQNIDRCSIKKNSMYTVTFKQHTMSGSDVGNGGYYIIALYDEANNKYYQVAEWYEPQTTFTTLKSFTFVSPDIDNLVLVFGVHNKGYVILDDISIVEKNAVSFKGENKPYPVNTPITYEKGLGITEDFESGSLHSSSFTYGVFNLFKLTKDPDYVINGDYSGLIWFEEAEYVTKYFEVFVSNPKYFKFEANQTYKITMKYKVVDFPIGSMFYLLFRDSSVGGTGTDLATFIEHANPGQASDGNTVVREENGYKVVEWTIKLKNFQNYKLMLGAFDYQTIVYDDILIEKVS